MFDFIPQPWGWIGSGLITLAIIGYLVKRIRDSGRDAERARRERIDAQAVRKRDEVEDAVAGRTPDENRRRFGRWAKP